MKKALISIGILCALGMTACGGSDSNKDDPRFQEPEPPVVEEPYIRVVFNPAMSDLNVPNDLLMIPQGDFFDFTINSEGTEEFDSANPQHALSALDGWSVHQPMAIRVETPDGMDIDPTSVGPESIKLFEATQALEGTSENCLALAATLPAPGVPCEIGRELVYGEDFVASYTPGSHAINVVPLKVLKASQGHLLIVTESLTDLTGRPVKGSGTWDLVRQDVTTNQVGVEALVPLQLIVNSMVNLLGENGVERRDLSYGAYFSTQSTGDVLNAIKKLGIAPFAAALQEALANGSDTNTAMAVASQFLPSINASISDGPGNAFEEIAPLLLSTEQIDELTAVGLNTCQGLMTTLTDPTSALFEIASNTFAVAGPFCAASIVTGKVNLPYFLDPAAPKTGWWKAACTSGATLNSLGTDVITSLLEAGQVGPNNDLCQLASEGQLFDLNLSSLGMIDPRNLTKYSPIPVAQGREVDDISTMYNEAGTESLDVHFTVPDETVIATISAATNGAVPAITKPDSGWPIVMFQHGITGEKENVLPLSAALSLAGFATVSIDHPLHGGRGLQDIDGSDVNASTNSISDYLNFASLLTGRDNAKQSSSDIVGLRLALNAIIDTSGMINIDLSKVHYIAHSLGSITGTAAVATANKSMGEEFASFDSMYAFNTAVLNVPSGGVPSFILESPDFGPLVKGSLLAATSNEFLEFLTQYATTNQLDIESATRPAYEAFISSLTPEELAPITASFSAFGFAAQTALDSADPIAYAAELASTTPVLTQLIVGGGVNDDGSIALTDQVNPITTSLPLVGGQPLADLLQLEKLTSTADGGGVIRFISGDHFSLLLPNASAATTQEIQNQAVSFFASEGQSVVISDTSVIEN